MSNNQTQRETFSTEDLSASNDENATIEPDSTDAESTETGEASLKYRLTGIVQNVGFRHFLLQAAKETGMRGWAKNESDGSLVVLLCGNKDTVSQFLPRLQGPNNAQVSNMCELLIEEDQQEDSCPAEFEIR